MYIRLCTNHGSCTKLAAYRYSQFYTLLNRDMLILIEKGKNEIMSIYKLRMFTKPSARIRHRDAFRLQFYRSIYVYKLCSFCIGQTEERKKKNEIKRRKEGKKKGMKGEIRVRVKSERKKGNKQRKKRNTNNWKPSECSRRLL